jgi:hypothetical protein
MNDITKVVNDLKGGKSMNELTRVVNDLKKVWFNSHISASAAGKVIGTGAGIIDYAIGGDDPLKTATIWGAGAGIFANDVVTGAFAGGTVAAVVGAVTGPGELFCTGAGIGIGAVVGVFVGILDVKDNYYYGPRNGGRASTAGSNAAEDGMKSLGWA